MSSSPAAALTAAQHSRMREVNSVAGILTKLVKTTGAVKTSDLSFFSSVDAGFCANVTEAGADRILQLVNTLLASPLPSLSTSSSLKQETSDSPLKLEDIVDVVDGFDSLVDATDDLLEKCVSKESMVL